MTNLDSKNARATRVLIAKDVLKQLLTEKIIPTRGTYLSWDICDNDHTEDLNDENTPPCNVCALGAAFVALSKRFSLDRKQDQSTTEEIFNQLYEYFEKDSLLQIEAAFECWSPGRQYREHYDFYYPRYEDFQIEMTPWNYNISNPSTPDVRLAYIMLNIIEHDGDFNPQAWLKTAETGFDENIVSKLAEKYQ